MPSGPLPRDPTRAWHTPLPHIPPLAVAHAGQEAEVQWPHLMGAFKEAMDAQRAEGPMVEEDKGNTITVQAGRNPSGWAAGPSLSPGSGCAPPACPSSTSWPRWGAQHAVTPVCRHACMQTHLMAPPSLNRSSSTLAPSSCIQAWSMDKFDAEYCKAVFGALRHHLQRLLREKTGKEWVILDDRLFYYGVLVAGALRRPCRHKDEPARVEDMLRCLTFWEGPGYPEGQHSGVRLWGGHDTVGLQGAGSSRGGAGQGRRGSAQSGVGQVIVCGWFACG